MDVSLIRFLDILRVLSRHEADFIVVGGAAAILEGAPISTLDLDILMQPSDENRGRLLAALGELNARYLDPAGRHLVPDEGKLASLRLHRLITDFGPLDVLTQIGQGHTYADLADRTTVHEVAEMRVRTLRLEAVIQSKEEANREKDQAVLPVLRRTLELRR